MRECLPLLLHCGMGLADSVALITDGSFPEAPKAPALGHVSPEASARGPIANQSKTEILLILNPGQKIYRRVWRIRNRKRFGG